MDLPTLHPLHNCVYPTHLPAYDTGHWGTLQPWSVEASSQEASSALLSIVALTGP